MNPDVKRVLIFRLGSLGDTVVALPAFQLLARVFRDAERRVLTQVAVDNRAAPVSQVLSGSGLVHGYIEYPLRSRDPRELLLLRREIRAFRPDVLVYLVESRGWFRTRRDALFFRWCGIPRLIGVPYSRVLRRRRKMSAGMSEFEGARLLRCLAPLAIADVDADDSVDLRISESERTAARNVLRALPPAAPILAISTGAKVDVKDWGDSNWSELLRRLQETLSGWSVVALGAAIERDRSDQLLTAWQGQMLNLCGDLSVRESAAVLQRARLFVGHDSGPMHLAAAVGTVCVAIFSSRNLPGEWFPRGRQHRVLYTNVPCRGCGLDMCRRYDKMCIAAISPKDVVREIEVALRLRAAEPAEVPRHGISAPEVG